MKVEFLGQTSFLELTHSKTYEVLAIEGEWYRVVDDSGEDYLYPPEDFEIVEENNGSTPVYSYEEACRLYTEELLGDAGGEQP